MTAFAAGVSLIDREPVPDPDLSGSPRPDDSPTALTIAMVGDARNRSDATDVVLRLAELAVTDELLVVYGLDGRESMAGVRGVVAGLRSLLPRHAVVAIHVTQHNGSLHKDANVLDDLLDGGNTAIATTPAAMMPAVAAELCDRLQADRVLLMSHAPAHGIALHEIWRRRKAIGRSVRQAA